MGEKETGKQPVVEDVTDILGSEWFLLPDLHGHHGGELTVRVKGREGHYEVNLTTYTCECPDWTKTRGSLPERDVRRSCKHIVEQLRQDKWKNHTHGLIRLWCVKLSAYAGVPVWERVRCFLIDDGYALLMFKPDNPWVEVLAEKRGKSQTSGYDLFGFNPGRVRWTDGYAPKNAMVLRQLIAESEAG